MTFRGFLKLLDKIGVAMMDRHCLRENMNQRYYPMVMDFCCVVTPSISNCENESICAARCCVMPDI